MKNSLLFGLCLFLCFSCSSDEQTSNTPQKDFNFNEGTEGWQGFFSDYPHGSESFYELTFKDTTLPAPLDQTDKALLISGNNHSDDLLSLIYKKIEGLKPQITYSVSVSVDLASKVRPGDMGIGGSPNLMLGVGCIPYPPQNTVKEENLFRPNFESALQSGLPNQVFDTLGRIGVSDSISNYTLINRNNFTHPFIATANEKGELWLMIGTDSGFEGITTLYYTRIQIKLEEAE